MARHSPRYLHQLKRNVRPEELREAARSVWRLELSELSAWSALRCMGAFAVLLGLGLVFHATDGAAVAASGALTVGFASFQKLRRSCIAPMLLSCVGITLSTFAGTTLGHSDLGFVAMSGLWGYLCGLLAAVGPGAWWIGLQCAIYVIIASHYPVGLGPALVRSGLMLGGGLLQAAMILSVWYAQSRVSGKGAPEQCEESLPEEEAKLLEGLRPAARALRENLSPRTEVGHAALRRGITLAVAAGIARLFDLPNGYWVPMTALLVQRADVPQTFGRGLERVAGTLVGAGVATLVVVMLKPGPEMLVGLVLLAAWFCFLLIRVNYAAYAVFITGYVVFLLALAGLPATPVVESRLMDTALGGALALLAHFLWPPPPRLETVPNTDPSAGSGNGMTRAG